MLTAAVSGSFHRHMEAIASAVRELAALDVRVLSPADPTIVAQQGEFLFVASDPIRSVRLVQDRHLESIRASNFLWLICPDGYVGPSASMELGYAAAVGLPVFAAQSPDDLTLRQYVKVVPNISTALCLARSIPRPVYSEGILIDPRASVEQAHRALDLIKTALTVSGEVAEPASFVHREINVLRKRLALPNYMQ